MLKEGEKKKLDELGINHNWDKSKEEAESIIFCLSSDVNNGQPATKMVMVEASFFKLAQSRAGLKIGGERRK